MVNSQSANRGNLRQRDMIILCQAAAVTRWKGQTTRTYVLNENMKSVLQERNSLVGSALRGEIPTYVAYELT